ncbi:hypothetical protein TcG_12765 [Trypanosoma cruzi]|nr:hypothetical protein TcG_12765 [Trypanosoma cruzi]
MFLRPNIALLDPAAQSSAQKWGKEQGPQKVRANPNSVAVAAAKIDVPRGVPFLGPALTVPCSQRAVRRPLRTSTRACVSPSLPAPFVGCIRDAAIQRRA